MMTIQRMVIRSGLIGMWLASVFIGGNAYAVNIPPLPEMSAEAAALHPELVQRRAALRLERDQLRDTTIRHNSECKKVDEGSAADARCTSQLEALSAAVDRHVQASTQFIEDYNAAEAARIDEAIHRESKSSASIMPNADPMVVDARNVPSGLDQATENAIARAYPNASPDVLIRIRRGFQAVMIRDWSLAQAYFKDALNHDPGNPGIQSLVTLSGSLQKPDKRPAPADARNNPADKRGKPDMKGASIPPGKTTPSTEGARALSEKMFEDGMLFLNMGDYEHAEQMFRESDFQRNLDAGEPTTSDEMRNTIGNPGKNK